MLLLFNWFLMCYAFLKTGGGRVHVMNKKCKKLITIELIFFVMEANIRLCPEGGGGEYWGGAVLNNLKLPRNVGYLGVSFSSFPSFFSFFSVFSSSNIMFWWAFLQTLNKQKTQNYKFRIDLQYFRPALYVKVFFYVFVFW